MEGKVKSRLRPRKELDEKIKVQRLLVRKELLKAHKANLGICSGGIERLSKLAMDTVRATASTQHAIGRYLSRRMPRMSGAGWHKQDWNPLKSQQNQPPLVSFSRARVWVQCRSDLIILEHP